jgi:hypothetical protein
LLWLLELALEGRLLDDDPWLGRTLVLLEGRLFTVGRLLVVGLTLLLALGRDELLLTLMVGRAEAVPLLLFTLALEVELPDMLPLTLP